MTETKTYNGWTNYETWCVNLWLTNEPGTAEELRALVQRYEKTEEWKAADALKTWVEELMPDLGASLASDLLMAALSEVDWLEIVQNHQEAEDA